MDTQSHTELQLIPVITNEFDVPALVHAQNCIMARNAIFPHVMDARALRELDRVLELAKAGK